VPLEVDRCPRSAHALLDCRRQGLVRTEPDVPRVAQGQVLQALVQRRTADLAALTLR